MTRSRIVIKQVYSGLDIDDEGTSGNERARRRRKFCDGWFDGESNLREGVPIAKRASRDFYIGERTTEWMDYGWAEGNEATGLIVVENDSLGSTETQTYSWSSLAPKEGRKFFTAHDSDFLIIKWHVESDNEDTEFSLWENYGDKIGDDVFADTDHPHIDDHWIGNSGLLLYRLEEGHSLSIDLDDSGTGTGTDATATVILREILGT